MNINLKPIFKRLGALTGSLILLAQMAMPMGVLATAQTAQEVCPDTGGGWVKVDGLSSTSYTYTIPEGFTVTDNCYKAGNTVVYGTGASVSSTVFNKEECTAVGVPNGCNYQNLSHASFKLVAIPNGSITIVKNAIPDSTQNFNFTSNVSGHGTFQLDDETGANTDAVPESKTFSSLSAGTYNFAELATEGWYLDEISCPNISETKNVSAGTLSLTITASQNVTCTFTNRPVVAETGTITIIKDAQPNALQDFSFSHSMNSVAQTGFTLDDDMGVTGADSTRSHQFVSGEVAVGTHVITEADVTGWTLQNIVCTGDTGYSSSLVSGAATIDLDDGENVVCTFTNVQDIVTPELGSLTIQKQVEGGDTQDFEFNPSWSEVNFMLDDDTDSELSDHRTFVDLSAGHYTVTEDQLAGWDLKSIDCGEADVESVTNGVTVHLSQNEDVTCVFTNKKARVQPGKVTICHRTNSVLNPYVKITVSQNAVDGVAGNSNRADHYGEHKGPVVTSEEEAQTLKDAKEKWGDIIPPVEGFHDGLNWTTEGRALYDNDCAYVPQEEMGSLTVRKQVNGGDAQDFEFSPEWGEQSNFMLDDDADSTLSDRKTFSNLNSGDYTVVELLEEGWELKSINCRNADFQVDGNSVTVNLSEGENVTCVFTNKKARVQPTKVTICHRTNSVLNPYVKISVSVNAVDGVGGGDHYGQHKGPLAFSEERARELKDAKIKWGDIIPPVPGVHGGLNWTADGQAMYENDCDYLPMQEEPELGDVSGYKFHDENGNGVRNSGEDKLSGWTIRLWHCEESEMPTMLLNRNSLHTENDCDYEHVDSEVTNNHGNYGFNDLEEGWYKVCEVNKDGWTQ
ncbi:MAG: hypothetical protein M3Q36_00205, partial [bacterium]|nr:hypothetical protein [bacterium]